MLFPASNIIGFIMWADCSCKNLYNETSSTEHIPIPNFFLERGHFHYVSMEKSPNNGNLF